MGIRLEMRLPLVVLVLSFGSSGEAANISNVIPRRDITGALMDVHDGNVLRFADDGLYYWYGMGYQNCTEHDGIIPPFQCPGIYDAFGGCGFRTDHAVNLYSSPDLVHWTPLGDILPNTSRPEGIYFRPKVLYNRASKEYVLWVN